MEDSVGGDLHLLADDPHGLHLRVHARPCRTGLQGILLRRSEPQTPRSGGKGNKHMDPNLETSTKISKLIPGSSLTKGLFLLDLCIIQITKNIQFLNKKHKKP